MTERPAVSGGHQIAYCLGQSAQYLGTQDLFPFLQELESDRGLVESLEAAAAGVPSWQTTHFDSIFQFRLFRILIYALLRELQPCVAIETGVLHGMTSAFMLRALQRNQSGRLISIDLPSYPAHGPANRDGYVAVLPSQQPPGWMVAPELRERWDLRLGASADVLPSLSLPVGTLDFFLHDSEHTDETMSFELEFAWRSLSPGGVLVCDNIDSCDAFDRFCQRVNIVPLRLPAPDTVIRTDIRFGVLRRPAL